MQKYRKKSDFLNQILNDHVRSQSYTLEVEYFWRRENKLIFSWTEK